MISHSTSDIASNMRSAQRGALTTVFSIDKKLGNIEVFQKTIALAEARSSTAQNSLSVVESALTTIGVDVLAALERDDLQSAKTYANQSRALLNSVVATLNADVGGQSIFSGAGFDTPALESSDVIMTDIEAIVAAAPDTTIALNDIHTYFNDPAGGFATSIYLGSTVDAPELSISEGLELNPLIRADTQPLRDTLRILAVSAVVAEGAFAGDALAQKQMLNDVATDSVIARDDVIYLRQDIGHAQSIIAETSDGNATEKSMLQITRNNLLGADPYETATRLTELQTQLESLYLLTARLSGLSLANFLR